MEMDALIAKIKSDFEKWDRQGLIKEVTLYNDILDGLKKFGENIMVLQDAVVKVKNGKATLPDNFHSLYLAVKCSPRGYYCDEKAEPVLQNSLFWTERHEYSQTKWGKCGKDSCSDVEERVIIERTYLDNNEITWYYDKVEPLSIVKGRFNNCHKTCRNMVFPDSSYNIYINGKTLNTNFSEGDVYLQYYGLDKDDDGKIIIPDTPKGELQKFLEFHAKSLTLLNIVANKDDANAIRLQQLFDQKAMLQLNLALTETKAMTLTPDSFKKLEAENRKYIYYNYECNLPFNR